MIAMLLVSFDLIRSGEPETPYSIASLLAFLKKTPRYGKTYLVQHRSFDLHRRSDVSPEIVFWELSEKFDLGNIQVLAISAYIWSDFLLKPLLKLLRGSGFAGKIVLGGYQISAHADHAKQTYPEADHFISGYAEYSLFRILTEENVPLHLKEHVDFSSLPSPYLSEDIIVEPEQGMIRWETKRGCPYRCSFCAHRDANNNGVYGHLPNRLEDEISFFKNQRVKKINVLDPVFNMGNRDNDVLEKIVRSGSNALFALQTHFETIKGLHGERFLELCSGANVHLEFGVQTVQPAELRAIGRRTDPQHVKATVKELHKRGISFEVSVIYGLPNQTPESFGATLAFLESLNVPKIVAFSLHLLPGTELFWEREKWNMRVEYHGRFGIPTVVSSNSYTKDGWLQMKAMAEPYAPVQRI